MTKTDSKTLIAGLKTYELSSSDKVVEWYDIETEKIIFGSVESKEFPPHAETTGTYHEISVSYNHGTDDKPNIGPLSFNGPLEHAPWGVSDGEAMKKKKDEKAGKASKKKPSKKSKKSKKTDEPEGEKKKESLSIGSKLDPKNPEHMAYMEKWLEMYKVFVAHLCSSEVKAKTEKYDLEEDSAEGLSLKKRCKDVTFPIKHRRDASGYHIDEPGKIYYKIFPFTPITTMSSTPADIPKNVLKSGVSMDFVGLYTIGSLYVGSKTMSIRVKADSAMVPVKSIKKVQASIKQGKVLERKEFQGTDDSTMEQDLLNVIASLDDMKDNEEADKVNSDKRKALDDEPVPDEVSDEPDEVDEEDEEEEEEEESEEEEEEESEEEPIVLKRTTRKKGANSVKKGKGTVRMKKIQDI